MCKDDIFAYIQNYLKEPPLIIWGSGATIGFGLPGMSDLKDEIGKFLPSFDKSCSDLETDKVMNVVSTNYDCILEYVWGYYGYHFTDGFEQHELSIFDEEKFGDKDIINLMKVHGSINWFDIDHEVRKLNCDFGHVPVMIPPGKNKYRSTHKSPYRELMQLSDNAIKKAQSFLVVGFGFNDEHITPLVRKKTKAGTPIVIVTMKVTNTTKVELEKAKNVIFVEADSDITKSHIQIRDNGLESSDSVENEPYWKLTKFMDILL